jgi:hypothetical protein
MGEKRKAYRLLVGKPEGKRQLVRSRSGGLGNIKLNLGGIQWGGIHSIDLAQERHQWRALVNMVMNVWVL